MEEIVSRKKCSGCTACMSICPKHAISMIEDNNGFKYPTINNNKCINCGLCKKTCPVINTKENESLNECYVAYSKEDEILKETSSGGIFPLIANEVLSQDGIVIGATLNDNNKLIHVAISKKNELDKLKGSKYLQSDLKNIFEYIKENLKENIILFVGTPCQVAGLKAFIKKDRDNLICIDLICHGVPSYKLFNKYIKELEEKNNDKLLNYNFRNKETGWDTYSNTATFKNKKVTELAKDNNYMKLFLSNIALRESCFNCNFKLGNKYSDITLGDFWGIQSYYQDMYNKKGVSAIIINTKKGNIIFDSIKKELILKRCKLNEIMSGNPSLSYSSKCPINRKKFFKDLDKINFDKLVKKYAHKVGITRKLINKIKRFINVY